MTVSLLDLDINKSKKLFPNLALMKLSAYYQHIGHEVYLNFPLVQADLTFASCVFTWHKSGAVGLQPDTAVGGPGIDLASRLPDKVEHTMPDYDLYPGLTYSMGFTTRGCIRKCPQCVVPRKEGSIQNHARIYEFWKRDHRGIVLLDNNLLASSTWRLTMDDLIEEDLWVDFNQGLDIRLVTEEVADYLRRLRARQLRFAFDNLADEEDVRRGIKLLLDAGINSRKLSFYVLYGFRGDRTAMKRLKILQSFNVDIYPMAYKGEDGKEPERVHEQIPTKYFHGARANISKLMRLKGRIHA